MPHATHAFSLIRSCRILSGAAVLAAIVFASSARAQFSPGPNPVSGNATSTQTLAGGTGTVTASGSIKIASGTTAAVTMSGGTAGAPTTLANNGAIQQNSGGRAIQSSGTNAVLVIQNNAGATISTTSNDTVAAGTGSTTVTSVSLTNAGTISSAAGGQAVNFNKITSGTNSVINTGTIQAFGSDAVRPGVNGTVVNSGTIFSTQVSGSSSDGVDVQNNTGVIITNNGPGLIEGGRHGITGGALNNTVTFTTSVTNNAGATIKGDNGSGINLDGFNALQTATIINNGIITGNGVTGDGDGIDVDGLVNVTNTGTIRSINAFSSVVGSPAQSEGITVGGGTITNSGLIEGLVAAGNTNAVGRGISFLGNDITTGPLAGTREAIYGNAVVNNNAGGMIRGDSDSGIAVDGPASGFTVTINNNAGATIQGGGTTNAAIRTGADNDTITNFGTIDGSSSGKAVDMGAGNNTLNYNGGTIIGSIDGGTGSNNTLNLGSGVTHTYATANFQNINVASGSSSLVGIVSGLNLTKGGSGTLVLSGANTYTGTTIVSAGTLKVNNTSGSGTGSSSVQVQSGATLGGSGTISGPVTVDGIIAPGNSIGTLNVGNNVTWNGSTGNKWNFELGAGNMSDRLNITGDFLKGSGSNFYFDFLNSATTGTYVLVDWSGSSNFLASDFSFANLGGGLTGSFALNGSQLEFTAIPEPAATSLFASAGVLAFAAYLRRRRATLV